MRDRKTRLLSALAAVAAFSILATPASAAGQSPSAHGQLAHGQLYEGLPFAGLLLSIALGPIVAKRIWHVHYGWAAAVWAVLALVLMLASEGLAPTWAALVRTILDDYLPFILMLFALYATAGGIVVSDFDRATPRLNTILLAAGTIAAGLIGATGASMIFIRPLLQANAKRPRQAHVVIFFIFLVSNIGGVLTPLGNPPLFFGFLNGVDFFWPLRALWPQFLFTAILVLAIFYFLDSHLAHREAKMQSVSDTPHLTFRGVPNLLLILVAVAAILTSAFWRPGIAFEIFGTKLELQTLVCNGALAVIGLISLALTPKEDRAANHFSWEPFEEVAKLFAAIFITIIPVMTMLAANGPLAPLIALLKHADGSPNNAAYFWASGLLSSFLDNGPTYLVFFVVAGGHATTLMGPLAKTLQAISLGAVFMGALTYVGNAPNFLVFALARRARVDMPGFFGYMAWSTGVLVPVFAVLTLVFFR